MPDDLLSLIPFATHLGIRDLEATADRAEARLDWAPELCTAGGILHGGVLMALADSVGAVVAFLGLPQDARTATVTSTTQMLRGVSAGTVRAVAEPLHRGRSAITVQTSVYDDQDRLVAQTTQVQAVLR